MAVALRGRRRGPTLRRAEVEVTPPAFSHTAEGERNPPPWPGFDTQRPTDGEMASAHYETNSVAHVAWERLHAAVWPARTEETVQQSSQQLAAFWGILGGGAVFAFFAFMAQPVIR